MSFQISLPPTLSGNAANKLQLLLTQTGARVIKPMVLRGETQQEDQPVATSQLGTPVYSALEIKAGSFQTPAGSVNYPGVFLDCCLLTVSQTKNIVETAVQGRSGTVKEFISDGDYIVNVQGIISSASPRRYPTESVADLLKCLSAPVAVAVISKYLQQFGIYEIVVRSYDLGQKAGFQSSQAFSVQAVSDQPFELKLAQEK